MIITIPITTFVEYVNFLYQDFPTYFINSRVTIWNIEFLQIARCIICWYVVLLHTNKLYNE